MFEKTKKFLESLIERREQKCEDWKDKQRSAVNDMKKEIKRLTNELEILQQKRIELKEIEIENEMELNQREEEFGENQIQKQIDEVKAKKLQKHIKLI